MSKVITIEDHRALIAERDALAAKANDWHQVADSRAEEIVRLAAENSELAEEVQNLQRALSFWHPGVPELASEEIRDRAADDAMLLCGFHGPHEIDAIGRGWIKLIVAPQLETKP